MDSTPEQQLQLQIQGLVRGWVFGHACMGWRSNWSSGAGSATAPAAWTYFWRAQPLSCSDSWRRCSNTYPHCRIDQLHQHWRPATGELTDFQIAPSAPQPGPATGQGIQPTVALTSPDLAICPDCLADLRNPHNRRYGYPLISCTHCGPRYSVVDQLPFERHNTSLADFPLCPSCEREYADPGDRRFHAQTISCPSCGPQLRWQGDTGTAAACISAAVSALQNGQIVALQGMGVSSYWWMPAIPRPWQACGAARGARINPWP